MSKEVNTVDTAQKGQTTQIKSAEERRIARENNYRSFRLGALKRRCVRMKLSQEDTEKAIQELYRQLNSPNQYRIIVTIAKPDMKMLLEALANANIKYLFKGEPRKGDGFVSLEGDQGMLAKVREISPPSAKIYPYVKKHPPILEVVLGPKPEKEKKPTNNTVEAKKAAKARKKEANLRRAKHKKGTGWKNSKLSKKKTLLALKKAKKATSVNISEKSEIKKAA